MQLTPEQWRRLPLEVRQWWWRETNYGEHPSWASEALLERIRRELKIDAKGNEEI